MIKTYFKIAYRNLLRSKGFSFINILGLAIGMAGAMLVMLWIQNEFSYDKFHEKKDRLYSVWNRDTFDGKLQCWNTTAQIVGPTLKKDYPEIEDMSRFSNADNILLSVGDKKLNTIGSMVDPAFLRMFSFPLKEGNVTTALNGSYSVVLTEKLAHKIFGDEPAMGKMVRFNNEDNFTVTGILKDLPNNTQFNFEYLAPWDYMVKKGWADDYWENNSTSNYVLLKPGASLETVNNKIKNIVIEHTGKKQKTEVFLHPAEKWRLYSSFENGVITGGRIDIVKIFGITAAFILLIACINFMNLSTARSEKRAREVGIRKVAGARKNSLVIQFLAESIMLSLIAVVIALVIVNLSLPAFNKMTDKQLFIQWDNIYFWLVFASFTLFTGIIAGSYPAFFLSSFKPIKVLKGTFKSANALIAPRKVLVVLQFTFAIQLIIATIVVQRQLKYAMKRDIGYKKDNLLYVSFQGDIKKNYSLIKGSLLSKGIASHVVKSSSALTEHWSDSWDFEWQGKDPNNKIDVIRFSSDKDLLQTTGMKLAAGRDLDLEQYPTDSSACLINETAAKTMGFKNPIGQTIKDDGFAMHVVGVVKDFILESPYQPVQAMVIGPRWFNGMHIKLSEWKPVAENLEAAAAVFKQYNSEYPFEYRFIDESYARKFNNEKKTSQLAGLFAALTIFISCLGLFGLAAYMAENRVKEIGVRKVLGASVPRIAGLLSKDFIKLVIIAILIASPASWMAMNMWLKNYSYRTDISWWIFPVSGAIAILIALLTVSSQAIKAAMANPIKSLRTE